MTWNDRNIHRNVVALLFLSLILIVPLPVTFFNVDLENNGSDHNRSMSVKKMTSSTLSITLITPENSSGIRNITELLFQLGGSMDKQIFYRWSTEGSNSTISEIDEYLIHE